MTDFDYASCENLIGYTFSDKTKLLTAFTHKSFANENSQCFDNERYEFLGDSLLGFLVAEYYFKNTDGDEGVLTVKKRNVVSNLPLSRAIQLSGLEKFLRLGKGERKQFDASPQKNVCENLFEAIVAAIYLDGGIDSARKFVNEKLLTRFDETAIFVDYKSDLQNLIQSKKSGKIDYEVIDKQGPDHMPTFTVQVTLNGEIIGTGKGKSKSNAEKNAARNALSNLKGKSIV